MTINYLALIIATWIFAPTEKAPTNDPIAKSIQYGWYSNIESRALKGTSRTHRNAVHDLHIKKLPEAIANRDAERLRTALCACRIPPERLNEVVDIIVVVAAKPALVWLKSYLKVPALCSNMIATFVDKADWPKFRTLLAYEANISFEGRDRWVDLMCTKMIEAQRRDDLCKLIFAGKLTPEQRDRTAEGMINAKRCNNLSKLIFADKVSPESMDKVVVGIIKAEEWYDLYKLISADKVNPDLYDKSIEHQANTQSPWLKIYLK